MRLFVAIDPAGPVAADLASVVDGLPLPVGSRLAARSGWHLTLAFLGDVPPDRVPAAVLAVERTAAATEPFSLRLNGSGRFQRPGRKSVLWAAVGGDLTGLHAVGATLRRELDAAGQSYDERPLNPHLTLAFSEDDLGPAEAALAAYQGPQWTAGAVRLYRSDPGPVYTLVAEAPLSPLA